MTRILTRNLTNSVLLFLAIALYLWSVIGPEDYFVWFLETFPILIGAALMLVSKNRFPLSPLLYRIVLVHMMILMIGGHYTYAKVPLFDYFKEVFELSRNNYDKVGHFFQGITPALLTRELILRRTSLRNPRFIGVFSVAVALGFSALYEIFEWLTAVFTDEGTDFVSMQGDVWDTQKDMLFALLGAVFALVFLGKMHDRSLRGVSPSFKG